MIEMERDCACGRGTHIRLKLEDLELFQMGLLCVCGSSVTMPDKDACPACGGSKWRYDLKKGWLRTCCSGKRGPTTPSLCPMCKSRPHAEDCGLWSPYTKEPSP